MQTTDAATPRRNAMYGPCAGCGQELVPGDPIAFIRSRFWCRACAAVNPPESTEPPEIATEDAPRRANVLTGV